MFVRVIDTQEKLTLFLPGLRAAKWIALDTEADSLHAYPEKLCLMQVSIEGLDVLMDTLSPVDFTPALEVFQDHELIFHGSDYDLRLLRRTFQFTPRRIFDTMLAARLLGYKQIGLQSLVKTLLGVVLEKGPQKADWGRRPLTPRMLEYARNDTRYLKPLADLLRADLKARGRLEWHRECCARFIQESAVESPADPDRVWRVKGSHALDATGLAILRSIWLWREQEALAANRPPFFVLMPETMVAIAARAAQGNAWESIMPRRFSPRRRSGLLQAVQDGLAAEFKPAPLRQHPRRLTELQMRRYHELERLRDRQASDLGLDPALIASRADLLELARSGDTAARSILMPWQRHLLNLR